ncbi:olfactory receptor 5H8-like [Peromyscus leucopus]|uniref:olfactory receptor 5H8-like n=1 Tax=Peromyscus leucopus TaxID=10041 RepID=UPI0010A15995|nr:olfactory receptor 5H8-like [Peromyscus leucopus]
MDVENVTLLTEFVLEGLTHQSQWKVPLFLAFLVIYLVTIVGNFSLITLIWSDPHLHIPMYLFLSNLAFVDSWLSSTVTPKLLITLSFEITKISLPECLLQFFSFAFSASVECFLLTSMAYDRYVAICKPLLYPMIMTNRLCFQLVILSFAGGFLHALIHEVFLVRLTFCNSNVIHHFYCDVMPFLKISCSDPSISFLLVFALAGTVQVSTMVTVLVSYTCILFTILQSKSFKGVKKAFSTCGAHLLSVSLYYGPLLFMYVCPASRQADDENMIDSLFYTVIIPVLNPIIYNLRNKQVIDSVRKKIRRNV